MRWGTAPASGSEQEDRTVCSPSHRTELKVGLEGDFDKFDKCENEHHIRYGFPNNMHQMEAGEAPVRLASQCHRGFPRRTQLTPMLPEDTPTVRTRRARQQDQYSTLLTRGRTTSARLHSQLPRITPSRHLCHTLLPQ